MKVSINLANSYSNVKLDSDGIEALAKKIGSQLGAIEDIEFWAKKYTKATVVRVVECVKHPNADKLSLCHVDDGGIHKEVERDERGFVQVVCGADNVRSGVLAVWLPPGSTIPATSNTLEPFSLESRQLRGKMSHGMLASPDELDLEGGHQGILLLENGEPGQLFADFFNLNDTVFDLENKMFTHRPDCFGVIGVARELAGLQNLTYKSPEWYLKEPHFNKPSANVLPLNVEVGTKLVSRFMAVAISDVTVKPSSQQLQSALRVSGIKPINNVVDITNYLMQVTAQPLHAYDYDKIKKLSLKQPTLQARMSVAGEKAALLNGKTIELANNDSVVIATDSQIIGIGGVMGGASTEVDENTKNIILECATFEPYNIRKTSMVYGLFTDAVTRFNKGQNNVQNDRVLAKALEMISDAAGGKQASEVFDIRINPNSENTTVETTANFINSRLGSTLNTDEISKLLQNVEFKTEAVGDILKITAPFWRTDIMIAEDIVEEVGRLHGYDKLPISLPTVKLSIAKQNQAQQNRKHIRQTLVAAGANELLTYSFVDQAMLEKAGQDPKLAFKISNALSPALEYYRLSLTPSLLDKVHANIKAGYDEFALFEIGVSHNKNLLQPDRLPSERAALAFLVVANDKAAKQYVGEPFYFAKTYLNYLADKLSQQFSYLPMDSLSSTADDQTIRPFEDKRSAWVVDSQNQIVGIVGEYKQNVCQNFKLPPFIAGFELNIDLLDAQDGSSGYKEKPKYPKVEQDISLRVSSEIDFRAINEHFQSELSLFNIWLNINLIDIYQTEEIGKTYTFLGLTWLATKNSYHLSK
ncbi:phenylalanine--tRNA ligase subunit beta [Candidatus Nomurabacteria bacterium]|nr:phenylalanine--tRNA ligase subunit beta [Candidatus Nomurabacteria bacterium]